MYSYTHVNDSLAKPNKTILTELQTKSPWHNQIKLVYKTLLWSGLKKSKTTLTVFCQKIFLKTYFITCK